jgi:hypothetical protein
VHITSLEVALASAIVTGVSAVASPLAAVRLAKWNAAREKEARKEDHEHARAMRLFDEKRIAYEQLFADATRELGFLRQAESGLRTDDPTMLQEITGRHADDADRWAHIASFASDPVVDAHIEFDTRYTEALEFVAEEIDYGRLSTENYRIQVADELKSRVEAAAKAYRRLRQVIRDELAKGR